MLATLADPPLSGTHLVFEPKYDGIRALVEIEPAAGPRALVRLWSRLGNEKTSQFPSIVSALAAFGAAVGEPLVVDGEIVALDAKGRPVGFQRLQSRIHLSDAKDVERIDREQPVAFIAFDLLREGKDDLRGLPLVERRARLERLFSRAKSKTSAIRISEQVARRRPRAARARAGRRMGGTHRQGRAVAVPIGTPQPVVAEAQAPAPAGVRRRRLDRAAKHAAVFRRAAARGVMSLSQKRLVYVGHTGTGFDQHELERVSKLLKARQIKESPFANKIKSNETAHWVRPDLVAQVRFTEWTDDEKLRHPVYLGLRDDKKAESVVREETAGQASKTVGAAERRKRPRPERGATSLRQGYGGPPKLQRRRKSPRESERGWGPREH